MITHHQNEVTEVKTYDEMAQEAKSKIVSGATATLSSITTGFAYEMVHDGMFRGVNGKFHAIKNRAGWNQYTGTKAHKNKTITLSRVAVGANFGLGVIISTYGN